MPFATICIFGLAYAGLSFAQTTTTSLYIPGADTQPLIGSIIGSDSAATTYALQCVDTDNCGFPGVFTLTEGPSTAAYTISEGAAFADLFDCSLAGTSSAVCFESNGGSEANSPGSSTLTLTGDDYTYMPVTITGNSEIKSGPTPTESAITTTSNSGVIKSGPTATGNPTTTTTSSKASGSGNAVSQSSPTTTSTSNVGGPAITGNAMLVMGGAAVAMAVLG